MGTSDERGTLTVARQLSGKFAVGKQLRAHAAVGSAVARGQLVRQPCEDCGATTKVQGHHDDYDKPLEVRWLCSLHHHRAHPQGGRASISGLTSIRQFRDRVPDEPVFVTQRVDGGGIVTVGLFLPMWAVDE